MSVLRKKIVIVGGFVCGKTCLLKFFTTSKFPTDDFPTAIDNYAAVVVLEDQRVELSFVDTGGAEDYEKLRSLVYPGTDVVLICFSVTKLISYENVEEYWMAEIRRHLPDVPVILVGTMTDKRPVHIGAGDEKKFITTEMGHEMAKRIKACRYMECSAKSNQGVQEVFHEAARVAILPKMEKSKKSCKVQ